MVKTAKNTKLVASTTQNKMESEESNEVRESSDILCILSLKKIENIKKNETKYFLNVKLQNTLSENKDFKLQVYTGKKLKKNKSAQKDASVQTDLINLDSRKVDQSVQFPSQPLEQPVVEINEIDVGTQVDSSEFVISEEVGINSLDVCVGSEHVDTSQNNPPSQLKSNNLTNSQINDENCNIDDTSDDCLIIDTDAESADLQRPSKTNSLASEKETQWIRSETNEVNPVMPVPENLQQDNSDVINISSDLDVTSPTKTKTESEKIERNEIENTLKRKATDQLPSTSKKILKSNGNDDHQQPSTSTATSYKEKPDSKEKKEVRKIRMRCLSCRKNMKHKFMKREGKSKHIIICESCEQRHYW